MSCVLFSSSEQGRRVGPHVEVPAVGDFLDLRGDAGSSRR